MKVKNVDSTLENIDKCILSSLSFLDNKNIYISIIFILFLYNTCLFSNINNYVSDLYENSVVKVIMLLLIIYVSRKSCVIGLLLAISYVISLNFKSIMENFVSGYDSSSNNLSTLGEENMDSHNNAVVATSENTESFMSGTEESIMTDNESFENITDNCMNNYMPKNQVLSNVCTPIATMNDSMDAQGLSAPSGYDKQEGYLIN